MLIESLQRLVDEFAELPGIGRKTAERLAYHVLMTPPAEALKLAEAIKDVKERVRPCRECFNLAEGDLCSVCASPKRDRSIICVVEQPKDVLAIENSGGFHGLYHVLQGHVNPLEGIDPDDLTVGPLVQRVKAGGVAEVLIATNPDLEGDGTALFVAERLRGLTRLTRIAKGIPAGTDIEYASKAILQDALSGRKDM